MNITSVVKKSAEVLKRYAPHTITHEPFSSWSGDFGAAGSYSGPNTYKAYQIEKEHQFVGPDGHTLVTKSMLVIPEAVAIDPKDRITLADGSTQPKIIEVKSVLDADGGVIATEIYF
jgi:hypothetical protein